MKKTIRYLLFILIIFLSSGKELYSEEIGIQLRLYEGLREMDSPSSRVISAYHLDRTPQNFNFSNVSVSSEQDTLKRVFNLKDVKLITYGNLLVEGKPNGKSSRLFVLNQKSIIIQLTLLSQKKNQFNLNVIEADKKTIPLLETKIIIPLNKTAVIGFEDSEDNIYFISFFRTGPGEARKKQPARSKTYKRPVLVQKVNPIYPEEAKKQGIQGLEILQAQIDSKGNITKLKPLNSTHPVLTQSAMGAINQWKYTPGTVSGIPTPVPLTVTVNFIMDKQSQQPRQGEVRFTIDSMRLRLLKRVAPEYPAEAMEKNIQGRVIIMAFVDKKGYIPHIKVFKGHPLLARAAVSAIKEWRFEPYIIRGKRQSILFTVTVDFNLDDKTE
jgi:TonB family protein